VDVCREHSALRAGAAQPIGTSPSLPKAALLLAACTPRITPELLLWLWLRAPLRAPWVFSQRLRRTLPTVPTMHTMHTVPTPAGLLALSTVPTTLRIAEVAVRIRTSAPIVGVEAPATTTSAAAAATTATATATTTTTRRTTCTAVALEAVHALAFKLLALVALVALVALLALPAALPASTTSSSTAATTTAAAATAAATVTAAVIQTEHIHGREWERQQAIAGRSRPLDHTFFLHRPHELRQILRRLQRIEVNPFIHLAHLAHPGLFIH
jgi:hypothetical protein